MANITETNISTVLEATDLKYTTPTSTGATQNYDISLKDGEDMMIILDARAAASGTYTITFNAGDGVAAKSGISFSCAAAKAVIAQISTGEIKKRNGNAKLTLSGGTNLSTDGVKLAFIKKLFVVNN